MSEKFFKILRSNCHGCYLSNTCENFHFVGNVSLNQAKFKSIPIFTLFCLILKKGRRSTAFGLQPRYTIDVVYFVWEG